MGLELFSGLLGAVIGSLLSNNVQKMNELDSKSGWREKLFDLASKDAMFLNDVYLLRTTLRYDKHELPYARYSFKHMSNQITDFCELLIEFYEKKDRDDEKKIVISDHYDREKIRIYARYLLKNHWEVFSKKVFFLSNEFKLSKEHEIGKKTCKLIEQITIKQLEDKTNDRTR